MFTATTYESSVTWDDGKLTGDDDLIRLIQDALEQPHPSAVFAYWGERDASLTDEFTAYLTIGDILSTQTGDVSFDRIPDNPDGYEPEGPVEEPEALTAAIQEFFNKNHDKAGRFATGSGHKVITAAQARGDSRPVSHDEFQRLATIGQAQLDRFAERSSPITRLDRNWDQIKRDAYEEVKKSWGGATIDSHTGVALPQGANAFAITVKGKGGKTVSVHENATEAEFNAAMDTARARFGTILARQSHYLGIFHDDANNRIDIDPVLVVRSSRDVETIGAASHSVGGAYNFRDGLGYFPPHVDTSPGATNKRDDYDRTYDSPEVKK